jgi:transposase
VIDGTGLSRGDNNRNDKLRRLRQLVPREHAVAGIDLADKVQVIVVTDHDSKVLARRRIRCRAWQLGPVLDWAAGQAVKAGYTGVTAACEPTGHRWQILDQLATARAIPLVCVQPLLVARAREHEDYTRDKTDDKDAVLIARLAGRLHCYQPERPEGNWSRLRHLGLRRVGLLADSVACRHQLRDLLECVWPAVLDTAAHPLKSATWLAAIDMILTRGGGDPARLARLDPAQFHQAVRDHLPRWGATRLYRRIANNIFAALGDRTGVTGQRRGALERAQLVLQDWHTLEQRLTDIGQRMTATLDDLGLTKLATSIPGISAISAAAILAETGDLSRYRTGRAVVKHAGLAPREHTSGTHTGRTRITGRGRPALRLAAWRAIWAAQHTNPVYQQRLHHLTTRPTNPLTPGQARTALAAALLRQLHAVITRQTPWNPHIAAPQTTQPTPQP